MSGYTIDNLASSNLNKGHSREAHPGFIGLHRRLEAAGPLGSGRRGVILPPLSRIGIASPGSGLLDCS